MGMSMFNKHSSLARRLAGQGASWQAVKRMREIATSAQLEQGTIKAISAVSEYAVSEAEYLKHVQARAEHANPDAAEAVAAIVNTALIGIVRRVGQYGSEVDW